MLGLNKLKEMKAQAEESKKRLDNIYLDGTAAQGKVKVTCTANRKVTDIQIEQSVLNVWAKEDVQSALIEAVNDALSQAEATAEAELKSLLPNIPGLGI
jgi:DNA-binding YbaB/EbfC family protein